ncbi:hypothetical protein LO762_00250 [Actinocorallia sp. API 0066]|uniref:hypothetical protein n=1 Tax=Actinocorallia sp. API 0066 TaxID=2896846 RepID=UPI001E5D3AE7|nr:hypothetical protein [Actinocorallia sp. API 0066]MCD0447633.1 hypothetical protein [Actinocorallia sp. API 0066]
MTIVCIAHNTTSPAAIADLFPRTHSDANENRLSSSFGSTRLTSPRPCGAAVPVNSGRYSAWANRAARPGEVVEALRQRVDGDRAVHHARRARLGYRVLLPGALAAEPVHRDPGAVAERPGRDALGGADLTREILGPDAPRQVHQDRDIEDRGFRLGGRDRRGRRGDDGERGRDEEHGGGEVERSAEGAGPWVLRHHRFLTFSPDASWRSLVQRVPEKTLKGWDVGCGSGGIGPARR